MNRAKLVAPFVAAVLLSALFLAPIAAKAQVLPPARGGTGASTTPALGQVLVGQTNGLYAPQATSTLGFITDFLGKTTSDLLEGANLYFTNDRADARVAAGTTTIRGMFSAGSGLSYSSGAFSLDPSGDWTGTFDGQQGSYYLDRANHTGTQLASTISDFAASVASILAGTTTDAIDEGSTNQYFTDARARAAISLTTTGTSGAATYDSGTGVLNIPQYAGGGSSYTFSYPLVNTADTISLAFGTTTSNTWSGVQTFANSSTTAASFDYASSTVAAIGTLSLTNPLTVPNGGTGNSSFTAGNLLYADTATTISGLTNVATGRVLISQGAGSAPIWSETATLNTSVVSPILTTNNNTSLSNFRTVSATGIGTALNAASLQIAGSSNVQFRTIFNGSAATTLTANTSYAGTIWGAQVATEATSGTHPLLANVAIKSPIITNGTAATTDLTSLYIEGAPTGITPTNTATALWVDTGVVRIDDTLGIATSSPFLPLSVGGSAYIGGNLTATGTVSTTNLTATNASTTAFSTAYASSTTAVFGTVTIPSLGTGAGTFLAANPSGQIIATSSPSGSTVIATSSTGAVPTSDGTQTITHGLGKTPAIIRISAIGNSESSSSGRFYSSSEGTWTSAGGNKSVFIVGGAGSANPTRTGTYSAYCTNSSNSVTYAGLIQNVGPTTFDILWDLNSSGSENDCSYIWEAQ